MKSNLKLLLLLFTICHSTLFFAQDYSFKNYNWEENPAAIEIPEQYKNQNEVILNRIEKIEIQVEGKTASQFHLVHEKIYINSDDAIERNNKIYIPFKIDESVVTNKVRVILKNGKIITLDKKDIKEETDEERGVKYNYFAVNGLEKGSVIEKMYVLQEKPEIDGSTLRMQQEYPIANMDFQLIVPEHLEFKTKSYNGLSEPTIDDKTIPKKTIIAISEKNIPALDDDEKYANWQVNLKLFRYKLDANLISGAKNLYNFKEFATNLYDRMNPELDKKSAKMVDEFCKSIPLASDPQEQIWNIENKIKKTITFNKYIGSKENLTEVFKTKQADELDLLKFYLCVFKYFKIENNVVFTSNRFKIPFDKEFESYENLSEILFYFPAIKKYLTPTEVEYRIPLFPNTLANNNGLFIKSTQFGGVNMGIGEVNFIDIPGIDISHDTMDIVVDFTKDFENPTITNHMTFGGYSAMNFQSIKDFVPAEQYKTILKQIAENYTVQTEYKTLSTQNDGIDFIGKKSFILDVSFDGKDLIQKAGDNYLVSIGQLIGKQMELYQENKRTLPIEIDYPHSYLRKITILLPKGATAKNLEKFNMDFKTEIDGKTQAAFTSKFTKKEGEIDIENTEYYKIVNYPKDSFDQYKAVINAAADFNKVVIVLNK